MATIKIHNTETGEIIERDMTVDELAQWEADKVFVATKIEMENQRAQAKAALLAKLGLTEEEAKLLL